MTSFFNWARSGTVRQARQMCSHATKLINEQRDLLNAEGLDAIQKSIQGLDATTRGPLDGKTVKAGMEELEKTASKWLKPYPFASYRENVEVFLVAICIAMGIRTFLLQPFKIPTGSMQPTLYGVTSENHQGDPNFQVPSAPKRWLDFILTGSTYYHLTVKNDGVFSLIDERPSRMLLFNFRQRFRVADDVYTVWFPPDDFFRRHTSLAEGVHLRAGQDMIKCRVVSGDHLFVDRMTYNFRQPARGDIVVFQTTGIRYPSMTDDQHYIKRLIGLPGDTLRIGDDRHVVVDGKRLDKTTPRFERLYDEDHWKDSGYIGHANGQFRPLGMAFFPNAEAEFKVPKDQYVVMGDNTLNSLDSRYWGSFNRENVIGKSFFVYWPFNSRWGWWGH